jgi:hypothetical protein
MGVGRLTLNALWWSSLKQSGPSNLFSLSQLRPIKSHPKYLHPQIKYGIKINQNHAEVNQAITENRKDLIGVII